jgi:hypothetical protein
MTREVRLTPDSNQFLIVTAETASQLDALWHRAIFFVFILLQERDLSHESSE